MIKKERPEEYQDRLRKVLEVKHLSDSLFTLKFERRDMDFKSGQFVIIGLPGETVKREYSIYSGINKDFIEVIIREVPGGDLSGTLKGLKAGDSIVVDGPAGDFLLPDEIGSKKFLFVASGTGISPFHSFMNSVPELKYKLLVGIRNADDQALCEGLEEGRYTTCMSQGAEGDYQGYVTSYLKENPQKDFDQVFICGNGNMVYDAFNLLIDQGYKREDLHAEIFF